MFRIFPKTPVWQCLSNNEVTHFSHINFNHMLSWMDFSGKLNAEDCTVTVGMQRMKAMQEAELPSTSPVHKVRPPHSQEATEGTSAARWGSKPEWHLSKIKELLHCIFQLLEGFLMTTHSQNFTFTLFPKADRIFIAFLWVFTSHHGLGSEAKSGTS